MKYRTAYPNELYHHGVLGMKWGVRRYQNYDGTRIGTGGAPVIKPSSLKGGVQRVGTGEAQRSSIPKALKKSVAGGQGGKAEGNAKLAAKAPNPYFERSVKQGKGKEDITPAEKIAKETRNASESSKKLVEAAERHDPKLKERKAATERSQAQKAKKMSDKELRDNINRIKMEREYVSLTTKETSSGYDKAKEVLDVVGDIASTVLALVSIYVTIKSLRKMKQSGIDDSDEEALMHSMLEDGEYDDEFISHAIALDDEYIADYIDDFLEHHGIKGMKWGVRRYQNYDGSLIGASAAKSSGGLLEKQKQKRKAEKHKKALEKERKVYYSGGWTKSYNEAVTNNKQNIDAINKKYENVDLGFKDSQYVEDWVSGVTDNGYKYLHEMDDAWRKTYSESIRKHHSSELAEEFIQNAPFMSDFSDMISLAEDIQKKK